MIIDTHAHVDMDAYDGDRAEVIQRARDNGVEYILNIGCDIDSSLRSMELANVMTLYMPRRVCIRTM